MAFVTSSVLGASLTSSDSTALFALNSIVHGSDDSEWQYIIATGTITTGRLVTIGAAGTAIVATTANLINPGAGVGYAVGVTQFQLLQGEYGFVAKRGQNMILACTGTVAPGNVLYLANELGVIATAATSATLAGIYITTSASTATLSTMARAILSYPRCVNASATPLG